MSEQLKATKYLPVSKNEKTKVLDHVVTQSALIQLWVREGDFKLVCRPKELQGATFILDSIESPHLVDKILGREIIIGFLINDFYYYSHGDVSKENGVYFLHANKVFFKKDRRLAQRFNFNELNLDESFAHFCFAKQDYTCRLLDISKQGASLEVCASLLDHFGIDDELSDFSVQSLCGDEVVIQRARVIHIEKQQDGSFQYGVEFLQDDGQGLKPLSIESDFLKKILSSGQEEQGLSAEDFDFDNLFVSKQEPQNLAELLELKPLSKDDYNIFVDEDQKEFLCTDNAQLETSLVEIDDRAPQGAWSNFFKVQFNDLEEGQISLILPQQTVKADCKYYVKLRMDLEGESEEVFLKVEYLRVEASTQRGDIVVFSIKKVDQKRLEKILILHKKRQENIDSFIRYATGND